MKKLTRRSFTAAGILAAFSAMTVGASKSCTNPFDPSRNEVEAVYGPPEYFGLESDDYGEEEGDDGTSEVYDPQANELEGVYGPPEDFDPTINEPECVYGPPEDFDPESNTLVDVYGPPPVN